MKRKTLFILITALFFMSLGGIAHAEFKYTLLESFPGFFTAGTTGPELPAMILAIYKFGIWTVGIAGLFMLTIGGFMYMASAGNNATVTSAKKIIADSLLGIIAALGAYLIMYVINPDLTNINIAFTQAQLGAGTGAAPATTGTTGAGGSTGTCSSGSCSAVDSPISLNSSGVDTKILKALIDGGEGCNNSHSSDGLSCGYGQIQYKYMRSVCGLSGSDTELCAQVQGDIQLDINCTATFVSTQTIPCANKVFGNTEASSIGSCYNAGYTGGCGTNNYCQRVATYYASCSS
jgi:hypothetical protein